MDTGFVYEWTCLINGKKYIGSHKGLETDKYIGSGIIFGRAIKKYGIENFKREILYRGPDYKKIEEEKLKEIDAAGSLNYYNLKNQSIGGIFPGELNGMYGKTHSEKSRKMISKTLKENYTEERKIRHSLYIAGENNGMYGKKHTKETKSKISKKNKNKVSNKKNLTWDDFYGKEKSRNIKHKLSETAKISQKGEKNSFYGHTHSIETKNKISEKHKGKKYNEERKKQIGEIMLNRDKSIYVKMGKSISSFKNPKARKYVLISNDNLKIIDISIIGLKLREFCLNNDIDINKLKEFISFKECIESSYEYWKIISSINYKKSFNNGNSSSI